MKLGILCTMLNQFGSKGFYNSQEIGLGEQLVKDGHQVIIYKGVKSDKSFEEDKINEHLTMRYIPMKGFGVHGYLDVSLLDRDLDGLLCFADQQLFIPHVYRFCQKHHIAFIPYVGITYTTLHGKLHCLIMDLLRPFGAVKLYRHMPVLAKTEIAKQELIGFGAKDITIAPVGLNPNMLRQDFRNYDKNELRREFGFTSEDVVLCCIARLQIDKRPVELIELLDKIKDRKPFKLLLIGKGELKDQVVAKIAELKLQDRVTMIDRLPYDDIWKVYAMSDYFLNMNLSEIFGMAILEAVYYRASVAALHGPGPDTSLKGMRGHCLCDDDQGIADWVCAPYPDQALLDESSAKIIEDFSWKTCAREFTRLVRTYKEKK